MSSPYRRRRSVDPEPPRRGGIPLFPLIVVVILAGLLVGGLLARLHPTTRTEITASGAPVITPIPTVAAATPTSPPTVTPQPSPTPTPHATPTASAKAAATASPTTAASATPTPEATAKPTEKPATATPKPTPTPAAVTFATPKPQPPTASPTPQPTEPPATGSDRAARIVRNYLTALARNDVATASSYLARGTPSEESFMADGGKVGSITARGSDAAGYKVTANVSTNKGDYFIEFTVSAGGDGYIITDHYAIKV